ncbi:MAG: PilZ domain-containing protein [Pseudomonadota bacterium]
MQTRRDNRIRTNAEGTYTTNLGREWEVEVTDLSRGGCRVDDPHGGLKLGEYVEVFVGGTGPHKAEVAWRQSFRVGLEFVQPIAQSVLARIEQNDWDGAASEFSKTRHQAMVRRFC